MEDVMERISWRAVYVMGEGGLSTPKIYGGEMKI